MQSKINCKNHESLQDGNFPFSIQIDKQKRTRLTSYHESRHLIRQNDITKSGLSIH